ncbi:MAG: hypothetical protein WCF67_00370 [Chitinophagaceae bacterium]
MPSSLLKVLSVVIFLGACTSTSRNTTQNLQSHSTDTLVTMQPALDSDNKPASLMDLPQTQYGGFVLKPGFYEAEFKTYCLQPGTPDPSARDAYVQSPVTGHRKDIVESVLLNSRENPEIGQRNIQLLLWSVVSGSDFNKLSPAVKADASKLLTFKQIFELKGGVIGMIKTVSNSTGILNANRDMQRLFEMSANSYEAFERLAVLKEPSQIKRAGVKPDQWYRQKENYYVRYFPVSYQKVRIQVYVPDGLLDAENKLAGEYLVFDPTGEQANPAYTNAQRLGIGAPVKEIIRVIIEVNKRKPDHKKAPEPKKREDRTVKQF